MEASKKNDVNDGVESLEPEVLTSLPTSGPVREEYHCEHEELRFQLSGCYGRLNAFHLTYFSVME